MTANWICFFVMTEKKFTGMKTMKGMKIFGLTKIEIRKIQKKEREKVY